MYYIMYLNYILFFSVSSFSSTLICCRIVAVTVTIIVLSSSCSFPVSSSSSPLLCRSQYHPTPFYETFVWNLTKSSQSNVSPPVAQNLLPTVLAFANKSCSSRVCERVTAASALLGSSLRDADFI